MRYEEVIIAAKGAPEAILRQSRLSDTEYKRYSEQALEFAKQGYRVLAVGRVLRVRNGSFSAGIRIPIHGAINI
jgi:magnesium-transporting ATPase (P-type)